MKLISLFVLATLTAAASAQKSPGTFNVKCVGQSCAKFQPEGLLWNILEPDVETSYLFQFEYDHIDCTKVVRKDGYAHSKIGDREYVQTCTDGKLGVLIPVVVIQVFPDGSVSKVVPK